MTSERTITIGCPTTAAGKLLSLGAFTTTAAIGREPTVSEMTATLRALMLTPTGGASYTVPNKRMAFVVRRTGVQNVGGDFAGPPEGLWDENGAICFYDVRINGDRVWNDTHIPSCEGIDVTSHLVSTYLWPTSEQSEYPPASD